MDFDPLQVHRFRKATLVACTRPDPAKPIIGGVLNRRGRVVASSLLSRTNGPIVTLSDADMPESVESLPGAYLFGGYLYGVHGHFLLESCSRLWAARRFDGAMPIVWLLGRGLTANQKAIFERIGVGNPHVFVSRSTRVDMLHVPEPAWRIQDWYHPEMPRLMGCRDYEPQPGSRVWLSRSRLPESLARIEGEEEVERRLAERGWLIWHPETETIDDQLDVLARAEHVSGFSGSAFHTMIMIRNFGGRVTMFNRGRFVHKDYQAVAEARSIDWKVIFVAMDRKEERPGNRTSFRLHSPEEVLRHLT